MTTTAIVEPTLLDPAELRKAFSRFGTGVTIITTRGADGRCVGLTVNSFNTVSLQPPIVLWSLSLRSPSLAAFRGAGRFVVNVLALDQLALSSQFAKPADDKFLGVPMVEGLGGLPVLLGCSATIECSLQFEQEVGDHIVMFGKVERLAHAATEPLLYCNGSYAQGVSLPRAAAQSA